MLRSVGAGGRAGTGRPRSLRNRARGAAQRCPPHSGGTRPATDRSPRVGAKASSPLSPHPRTVGGEIKHHGGNGGSSARPARGSTRRPPSRPSSASATRRRKAAGRMRTERLRMRGRARLLCPSLCACVNSPGGEARKSAAHALNCREATARRVLRMRLLPWHCWHATYAHAQLCSAPHPAACACAKLLQPSGGVGRWGPGRSFWVNFFFFFIFLSQARGGTGSAAAGFPADSLAQGNGVASPFWYLAAAGFGFSVASAPCLWRMLFPAGP